MTTASDERLADTMLTWHYDNPAYFAVAIFPNGERLPVDSLCEQSRIETTYKAALQSSLAQGGVRVKPLHWSVSEVFGKYKARGSGIFGEYCSFMIDGLTDYQITEKEERYETEYRRAVLSALESTPSGAARIAAMTDEELAADRSGENPNVGRIEASPAPVSEEMVRENLPSRLTRDIVGIENRTAQEVFDIMCDRIRAALAAKEEQ